MSRDMRAYADSVLPPDDELLAMATDVPQEWLDEEDPFDDMEANR